MLLRISLTVFIYSQLTSAASSHIRVLREIGTTCTTPDSQQGTCKNVYNCPSLFSLLTYRARETEVANFLRRCQCGTENDDVLVCCPNSGSPKIPKGSGSSGVRKSQTGVPTSTTEVITRHGSGENPTMTNQYAECGVSLLISPKIIDGINASLGEFPWIAALGFKFLSDKEISYSGCGGSLISDSWVVTAGHCILAHAEIAAVRLGDLNLNPGVMDKANPIDVPVAEVIKHPSFSSFPVEYDIALLRLKNPVTFTKYIRPICVLQLPEHKTNSFYENKQPLIAGWGKNASDAQKTLEHLQYTQIKAIPLNKCKQQYANVRGGVVDEKVICAGNKKKDSCQGDSGGPLMIPHIYNEKIKYYLAGVVSFGYGCGNTDKYPGIYTKVAFFMDWIEETIKSRSV